MDRTSYPRASYISHVDVAISGARGLVGTALAAALRADGHRVLRLARGGITDGDAIGWDPEAGRIDAPALEGVDAVVHLAGEGIVQLVPYKGTFVTALSEARLQDLLDFRLALEQFAVRRAIERATPEQLDIDPEDLQANYNLMLCYTGMGDEKRADEHKERYLRFKADEAAQALTGAYRQSHPEDNNERQAIHEHVSVSLGPEPSVKAENAKTARGATEKKSSTGAGKRAL